MCLVENDLDAIFLVTITHFCTLEHLKLLPTTEMRSSKSYYHHLVLSLSFGPTDSTIYAFDKHSQICACLLELFKRVLLTMDLRLYVMRNSTLLQKVIFALTCMALFCTQ